VAEVKVDGQTWNVGFHGTVENGLLKECELIDCAGEGHTICLSSPADVDALKVALEDFGAQLTRTMDTHLAAAKLFATIDPEEEVIM